MKPCIFVSVLVLPLLLLAGLARGAEPDLADDIVKMTGARTRVVWQHEMTGKSKNDEYAWSAEYQLMGFDTEERKARVILPGPASYGDRRRGARASTCSRWTRRCWRSWWTSSNG